MALPKTVSVRHGRFVVEVPAGWVDDTSISFSSPTEEGLAAPLSPKQAPAFRTTFNVTMEVRPDGLDSPRAFLEAMGNALRMAGADIEDVVVEDFSMGGRRAALAERKVSLGGNPARQLSAAQFIDENVVVASAATSESEIERLRPLLRHLLENVRFEQG